MERHFLGFMSNVLTANILSAAVLSNLYSVVACVSKIPKNRQYFDLLLARVNSFAYRACFSQSFAQQAASIASFLESSTIL